MPFKYYADSDANGNITAFYNDDIWDVSKIPTTAIPITFEEWQDSVNNPGKYMVQNKAFVLAPPPTAGQQLAAAKQVQIAAIESSFARACETFQSSALGSVHTYLADSRSMMLLSADYAYMKGSDYDGNPELWYTIENGKVSHTGAQLCQVFLNGRKWLKDCTAKKDSLESQIDAVQIENEDLTTALSQVSAFVWG
jgi:hypothetical protein